MSYQMRACVCLQVIFHLFRSISFRFSRPCSGGWQRWLNDLLVGWSVSRLCELSHINHVYKCTVHTPEIAVYSLNLCVFV